MQGLPACPINFTTIRSNLPEVKCWGSLPHLFKEATNNNSEGVTGNYNANITNNNVITTPITSLPNPHKFHKFHKTHKKMPFRGRRGLGLCGCLKVSAFSDRITHFNGLYCRLSEWITEKVYFHVIIKINVLMQLQLSFVKKVHLCESRLRKMNVEFLCSFFFNITLSQGNIFWSSYNLKWFFDVWFGCFLSAVLNVIRLVSDKLSNKRMEISGLRQVDQLLWGEKSNSKTSKKSEWPLMSQSNIAIN